MVAIGQSVSLLLYSIAPNSTWFYPIRIFHALTLTAFAPTALAITRDLPPPGKRGDTIGKFLTSFGITTMFGPFLCTFLVDYVDYPQLFQIAAIIPLLSIGPFLLIRRRSPFSHPRNQNNLSTSLLHNPHRSIRRYYDTAKITRAFSEALYRERIEKTGMNIR